VTAKARITSTAVKLLSAASKGLHHSALVQALQDELPDIPLNTIRGTVVGLVAHNPDQIIKPAKGLFQHTKFGNTEDFEAAVADGTASPKESAFYSSFAAFLKDDLEECTKSIPLGGSIFKGKWGTPDVIGIRRAKESDLVKFPTEIIAAEIKVDTNSFVTAFGQACAYRLFAHRSYLVVPRAASEGDLARLEALCTACGLGLILFDSKDSAHPNFTIRLRAVRGEPDMFYVNDNMKQIEHKIFD
jgi:hypothetical protein